jgi:hypothetical protein
VVEPLEPWAGMQVDFAPLGAQMLLGVPVDQLTNRLVALEDVLGPETDLLTERLYEARHSEARFDILEPPCWPGWTGRAPAVARRGLGVATPRGHPRPRRGRRSPASWAAAAAT